MHSHKYGWEKMHPVSDSQEKAVVAEEICGGDANSG